MQHLHLDYFAYFSSPPRIYGGIMHEIVLPICGERCKAVFYNSSLPWNGRYGIPYYIYSFYENGTLYVIIKVPLQGVTGIVPNLFIQKTIIRR